MAEPVACPACREPVIRVGGETFDAAPDPVRGQYVVLGDAVKPVVGPQQWAVVRQHGLPVYRRHGVGCRDWWYYRVHPMTNDSKE